MVQSEGMSRTRMLTNPGTGRAWGTRLDGNDVVILSGTPGSEKETRKPQKDPFSAWHYAEQEERKRLRKDFILRDPDATVGSPSLICALDRTYRGSLPLLPLNDFVLCSNDLPDGPEVTAVDAEGQVAPIVKLPAHSLIHKLVSAPGQPVLALVDHGIGVLNPSAGTIDELVPRNKQPASFLTMAGSRAAWFQEPELVVVDRDTDQELLRLAVSPQRYGGHSLQLTAELSPDGAALAVCSTAGQIQLIDVATGTVRREITGTFEMVTDLIFTPDQRRLLVNEQYGEWKVHCFDVATGEPRDDGPDLGHGSARTIVLDPDGKRLAIADDRSWLRIFDLDTQQMLHEFRVDQVNKTFGLAWVGADQIVIRTDLGFIARYPVPA